MKNFHPFFAIGTVGMIVIACLHIFLALGLNMNGIHTSFFMIYPIFLTLLILGVVFTVHKQRPVG